MAEVNFLLDRSFSHSLSLSLVLSLPKTYLIYVPMAVCLLDIFAGTIELSSNSHTLTVSENLKQKVVIQVIPNSLNYRIKDLPEKTTKNLLNFDL